MAPNKATASSDHNGSSQNPEGHYLRNKTVSRSLMDTCHLDVVSGFTCLYGAVRGKAVSAAVILDTAKRCATDDSTARHVAASN